MGNVIEVCKENMRVEFKGLEDHESLVKIKKCKGVRSASKELNAWSHWFSMPTTLKLDTSVDQVFFDVYWMQ